MNTMKRTPSGKFQSNKRPERIPLSLQAIFLSSNRGNEVHCAPKDGNASRVFNTTWLRNKIIRHSSFGSPKKASPLSVQPEEPEEVTTPKFQKVELPKSFAPSPQAYLNSVLLARGYSTQVYPSLSSAYYNAKPTTLQQASYGVRLVDAARKGDTVVVRSLLQTGLSPNACNQRGESLLHAVCRRGQADMLRILMEYGCEIRVADDYGRTPLHDAFWAATPNVEVVELLLQVDPRLFHIADARGSLPLAYVSEDQNATWIRFLMSKKDVYWPDRDIAKLGVEQQPPLTLEGPNSRPVPDPKRVLPMNLVSLVAAGRMEPEEAEYLMEESESETDDDDSDSEDSESVITDSDSESCIDLDSESYDSEDDDDFIGFGEPEMAHVAKSLLTSKPIQWTLPTRGVSLKSSSSTITTMQSEDDESHDVMSCKAGSNDGYSEDELDISHHSATLFDEDECALVLSSIGGLTPLSWSPAKRQQRV